MINLVLYFCFVFLSPNYQNDKVLVFTKTTEYRHECIEKGVQTIKQLGQQNGFDVSHSEDATVFVEDILDQYDLVIFLNTTGDILNDEQQKGFEGFIKAGGSFMGIHSAADTEYDWPWYGKLVGAYFMDHPEKSEAEIIKIDGGHPSCSHLPKRWKRYDEWYNYKAISQDITVVLQLDESTYKGGRNGPNHPIAWFQEYDGGRSFYTGLGHTKASYAEPDFQRHLLGGILYCLNR